MMQELVKSNISKTKLKVLGSGNNAYHILLSIFACALRLSKMIDHE